jgi:hypothetical protein
MHNPTKRFPRQQPPPSRLLPSCRSPSKDGSTSRSCSAGRVRCVPGALPRLRARCSPGFFPVRKSSVPWVDPDHRGLATPDSDSITPTSTRGVAVTAVTGVDLGVSPRTPGPKTPTFPGAGGYGQTRRRWIRGDGGPLTRLSSLAGGVASSGGPPPRGFKHPRGGALPGEL